MELVDQFIARYAKEFDFYEKAARLVKESLEGDLRGSGIRCIVTHRAKNIERLEDKCKKRAHEKGYVTVDDIYDDIVDLAGVRVALYFPGETEQVENAVSRLFDVKERREFPKAGEGRPGKEFSGYSAVHYRVKLKERGLGDLDRRYAKARIEIQVASVLMHAWSEVEHDLIYKPLAGQLSPVEESILDQLNGLVIAGELSLRMLQKASEDRVAADGRFRNHYELAAHLLSQADRIVGEPVGESGLGRVDILFNFLTKLNKETPADLAPYLESLHGNVEMRSLAEQVVDALLAEDLARYEDLDSVQGDLLDSSDPLEGDGDTHRQIGRFIESWVALEEVVRSMAPEGDRRRMAAPLIYLIGTLDALDADTRHEIDILRRIRNNVVHGRDVPPASYLAESVERVQAITKTLRELGTLD
ncbi:hypothetical protein [Streptomyces sp. NPDC056049]|uniref:hypothetical protein n=1 Tax=Streptomyces sp. NPDC056049 TaxID=3345693 RepID=UPI0035D6A4E9